MKPATAAAYAEWITSLAPPPESGPASRRTSGAWATDSTPPGFREIGGILLPRTTEIIKAVLAAPALETWRANREREAVISAVKRASTHPDPQAGRDWLRTFWAELRAVRQEAREQVSAAALGTAVHSWVEWFSRGLLGAPRGPEPPILEATAPAITSWQEWARDVHYRPLLIEHSVHCLEAVCGYCGTIDAVAEVEGQVTLCDWKRSSGVYDSYLIQAGAYAHGLKATEGLVVDRAIVLRLPQDAPGPAIPREIPPAELTEAFEVFRGLLATWRWRRALDERASEAMSAARQGPDPAA